MVKYLVASALVLMTACSGEPKQVETVDSTAVVDTTPVVKDTTAITTDSTKQ